MFSTHGLEVPVLRRSGGDFFMVPCGRSCLLLAFYSLLTELRDSALDRQFTAGKMKRLKPPELEA